MKQYITIAFIIVLFSCGQEKIVQLPEMQNAKITEVKDVSPAYIFYDETKPDSVELNRKNLIISTNWLVNIDKRLTLKQALPSIIKLQDKKRNAKMHKNENARNYYTCNDTSIKNLGFIDFTDVNYITDMGLYNDNTPLKPDVKYVTIHFFYDYMIVSEIFDLKQTRDDVLNKPYSLKTELKNLQLKNSQAVITLIFNSNLTIQDYISFKSQILNFKSEKTTINNNEFIIDDY